MKRRLFTILSALSLLLCVAVVVLWVVSYWWMPSIEWGHGRETGFGWTKSDHELGLSAGSVYYCRSHGPMVSVPPMAFDSSERSEWFGVVLSSTLPHDCTRPCAGAQVMRGRQRCGRFARFPLPASWEDS